jgi:2-dehydro-3-deoxygluconokinase
MNGGVVTLGETMGLVRADEVGALHTRPVMRLGIGGAESNVAIGLSRLGVPATWIGCLGADSIGDLVVREMRAEGVTLQVRRSATAPTGLMLKERPTSVNQVVTYYRAGSAGSQLTPDDVDPAVIAGADLLHLTGITMALSDTARQSVLHAVDIADDHGVPVSFDVNHRSKLWSADAARPHYRAVAARARYLFAGVEEALLLTGREVPPRPESGDERAALVADVAADVAALGCTEVVLKDGAAGAFAFSDGALLRQPAFPVVALDTVGAGDGFVAGYLAARLSGQNTTAALEAGARAGACACLSPGDWEGLPSRADLELLGVAENVAR